MRAWWLLPLLAALLVLLPGHAQASLCANSPTSTSQLTHSGAAGSRTFAVTVTGGLGSGTCDSADQSPGGFVTVKCTATTTGVPPAAPTTITVYAYPDNTQFGTPGSGSPIWSHAYTCNGDTSSAYCTSNGLAGGTASHGFLRLVVRAQQTTVPTYDVNNDNGGTAGTGMSTSALAHEGISCDASPSSVTDGNPTSSPSVYIGGDTFRMGITGSTYYAGEPATPTVPTALCGAGSTAGSAIAIASTATTTDFTVKGGPTIQSTPWPTGCAMKEQYQVTALLTTTGFTSQKAYKFAAAPAGSTLTDDYTLVRDTAKLLNRALTPGGTCAYAVGAQNVLNSFVMRGETLSVSGCSWQDARGNLPPNNQLGVAYANRIAQALADTTDFASQNVLFSASGHLDSTHAAATTATATTGEQYTKSVEEYGASRTSAELWNAGRDCGGSPTAPCRFDVSSTYTWADVFTRKQGGTSEVRSFTIGNDVAEVICKGLADARGNLVSGASVTVTQKTPAGSTRATINPSNTGGSGDSGVATPFDVVSPSGTWTFTCDAALSGNAATRVQPVTYVSPLTSYLNDGLTFYAGDPNPDGTVTLHLGAVSRVWDGACDCVLPQIPDDVVRLTVQVHDPVNGGYPTTLVNRVVMAADNAADASYTYTMTLPATGDALTLPIHAFVTYNITTRPFLQSGYYNYNTTLVPKTMNITNSSFDVLAFGVIFFLGVVLATRPDAAANFFGGAVAALAGWLAFATKASFAAAAPMILAAFLLCAWASVSGAMRLKNAGLPSLFPVRARRDDTEL